MFNTVCKTALLIVGAAGVSADAQNGESEAEQRTMLKFAIGVTKVAVEDRRILGEAKEVQKLVGQAISKKDPELGQRASRLLDVVQEKERNVLSRELRDARQAVRAAHKSAEQGKHAERGEVTKQQPSLLQGGASSGLRTAKIQHDIGEVEQRVAKIMRNDPRALEEEEELLHRAATMARRAGHARERFHKPHHTRAAAMGSKRFHHSIPAVNDQMAALKRYAANMARAAKAARQIHSETRATRKPLEESALEEPEVTEQSADLLGQEEESQHKPLADEIRELKESRGRLGPRGLHAHSPAHIVKLEKERLHAKARRVHEVLRKQAMVVEGEAQLSRKCKRLLSELSEVHEDAAEALDDGSSMDGQAVQVVGGLLEHAEQVVKQVADLHQQVSERAARSIRGLRRPRVLVLSQAGQHVKFQREQRLMREMERAEKAVQRLVRGPGAAKVRSYVTQMLERAKSAEKGAMAAQSKM